RLAFVMFVCRSGGGVSEDSRRRLRSDGRMLAKCLIGRLAARFGDYPRGHGQRGRFYEVFGPLVRRQQRRDLSAQFIIARALAVQERIALARLKLQRSVIKPTDLLITFGSHWVEWCG